MKGMYVFAEFESGVEKKFGLEWVAEKGGYYGLPEDIDAAAEENLRIREALENGDVEYV